MSGAAAAVTPEDLMRRLQALYEEARGPDRTLRGPERLREDLGIDSLQMMEMLVALEEQLRVEIVGDPRVFTVTTVDDLVELLGTLTRNGDHVT